MFMCAHVFDVALCGNTVRNVALGLWLVGHPGIEGSRQYRKLASRRKYAEDAGRENHTLPCLYCIFLTNLTYFLLTHFAEHACHIDFICYMYPTCRFLLIIFQSYTEFFLNDQKKFGEFGHNVRKDRLVNAVTVNYSTMVRQMTKMSQWKKQALHFNWFGR